MKTLHLSTLVLLLAGAFYSCTKEEATKNDGAVNATGKSKATASIEINYNPNPAPLSRTVYVTGTLTFDKAVNQFSYTVEKSTTPNGTNPDGTINWTNFQPTKYSETVKLADGVSATTFPIHFDFPAADQGIGKTGWQLHLSGQDVKNVVLGTKTLEVVKDPCVEAFTVAPKVEAKDLKDGTYEFTISYTLTSPADMESVHFQGGATSGGQFQHDLVDGSLTGGLQVLHNNKQNTVLYYEGPLTKCTPLTLSFKYIRKFSCPQDANSTVTGEWTATGGGLVVPYVVAPLAYSCGR